MSNPDSDPKPKRKQILFSSALNMAEYEHSEDDSIKPLIDQRDTAKEKIEKLNEEVQKAKRVHTKVMAKLTDELERFIPEDLRRED